MAELAHVELLKAGSALRLVEEQDVQVQLDAAGCTESCKASDYHFE